MNDWLSSDEDAERNAFMRTLREIAIEVGPDLERMRQHALFGAMVEIHGEAQVRQWLLLETLRTLREAECLRRQDEVGAEVRQLRAQSSDGQLHLSDEQWRALHRSHGLELKSDVCEIDLLGDNWLAPGVLHQMRQYFAHVRLR